MLYFNIIISGIILSLFIYFYKLLKNFLLKIHLSKYEKLISSKKNITNKEINKIKEKYINFFEVEK